MSEAPRTGRGVSCQRSGKLQKLYDDLHSPISALGLSLPHLLLLHGGCFGRLLNMNLSGKRQFVGNRGRLSCPNVSCTANHSLRSNCLLRVPSTRLGCRTSVHSLILKSEPGKLRRNSNFFRVGTSPSPYTCKNGTWMGLDDVQHRFSTLRLELVIDLCGSRVEYLESSMRLMIVLTSDQ